MNYLVATERFFGDRPSGGGRVAWELARLVRDKGGHVAILCGSDDWLSQGSTEVVEGIEIVRYPEPRFAALDPRRLYGKIAAARKVARTVLSDRRWDVVHSHMLIPGLAAFAELGTGARRICTIHSPTLLEQKLTWSGTTAGRIKAALGVPALRRAEARLYDSADALTCLSRFTSDAIVAEYGRRLPSRPIVIPWWSEFEGRPPLAKDVARRQLRWDEQAPTLFTLRRLVPRMGLDVFVQALHRVASNNVRFKAYIGGAGPDRESLQRLASVGHASDRIHFLGRMEESDLFAAYSAADAFILPTLALECFGIIALDALSLGLPVIASQVAAIPEMLEAIMPDLLVPPGDPDALATTISGFLAGSLKPPSALEIAKYVDRRYSSRQVKAAYLEVLL
jgi:glycosyltransferase involved in cell wall biosynthesis